MGSFCRSGAFRDRTAFMAALRQRIKKMKEGPLGGFSETWTDGPVSTGTLTGFGAKLVFTVRASEWTCDAELPSWLPIPQTMIEQKFDREFEELRGL
ncbi:MAG: hypothetical protein HYY16_09365 [Planctomycetes bacterium]|nr:hypothetical protein [Planctomycetota bacterium]